MDRGERVEGGGRAGIGGAGGGRGRRRGRGGGGLLHKSREVARECVEGTEGGP